LSPQNFEVIVVDNGSIDDTRAVAATDASWLPLRYSYRIMEAPSIQADQCATGAMPGGAKTLALPF
jgi:hypothetical protein